MDHSKSTIGFIGGGNMARALLAGLLRAGHAPAALRIADPDPAQQERLRELSPELGVSADNVAVTAAADRGMQTPTIDPGSRRAAIALVSPARSR